VGKLDAGKLDAGKLDAGKLDTGEASCACVAAGVREELMHAIETSASTKIIPPSLKAFLFLPCEGC
jgi:hypothetical protein